MTNTGSSNRRSHRTTSRILRLAGLAVIASCLAAAQEIRKPVRVGVVDTAERVWDIAAEAQRSPDSVSGVTVTTYAV